VILESKYKKLIINATQQKYWLNTVQHWLHYKLRVIAVRRIKLTMTTAPSTLESSFGKLNIDEDRNPKLAGTLPISYSEEELEAMRQVQKELIQKHKIDPSRIGLKTLALTTIVTKLRVEESAEKYAKYLQMVDECGVPSLRDDEALTMKDDMLRKQLKSYATCGCDKQGRSIMWINGRKTVPEEEEMEVVKAGIMYHTAIHADAVSLREGITFVIDTSNKPTKRAKNDQKLQKTWQVMPMRPQALLIAGSSLPLRVIINSLILVASFFSKSKVLDRIKFVKIEEALKSVPLKSAPVYLGGEGGGIHDIVQWTKQRIDEFPAPIL